MKIMVINGSPKGESSNTMKLTRAFLEGLTLQNENSVETIHLNRVDIGHCLGCFNCWTNTPGECVIKDDMPKLFENYITADLIIWSFPLYTYGMPSKVKAFLDRLLPYTLPLITLINGRATHPPRYDLSYQRHILFSTCGFCSIEGNYDALIKQLDILFGERLTKIICAEGELFSVPQLGQKCRQYLNYVKTAGEEYAINKTITDETRTKLNELLYPAENFIDMANASWNIKSGDSKIDKMEKATGFLRQMAVVYNKSAYEKHSPTILEFYFTDIDIVSQLKFNSTGCRLLTEHEPYTARIEVGFETWKDISSGRISGEQALFEKKYAVKGDFSLFASLGNYFGASVTKTAAASSNTRTKKSNMLFLLLPWIIFWSLTPISILWGSYISIIISAFMPLAAQNSELTIYDRLSIVLVTAVSAAALYGISMQWLLPASYGIFGAMWFLSAFLRIPLTAYYSCNNYGGETAFKNSLFIKTNALLTAAWGILYILTSVAAFFIYQTFLSSYTGLIALIPPILMKIFTSWFQKWYPARYAAR